MKCQVVRLLLGDKAQFQQAGKVHVRSLGWDVLKGQIPTMG